MAKSKLTKGATEERDILNYTRSFALHSRCSDIQEHPKIEDYFRIESRTLLFSKGIFICGIYLAGTHHAEGITADEPLVAGSLGTLTIIYASRDADVHIGAGRFKAAAGENTRFTRDGAQSSFTASFQFNSAECKSDDWGDASLNLHFLKKPQQIPFNFTAVRAAVENGHALIARVESKADNSDLTQIVEAPVQVANFSPNDNNLLSLGLFIVPWLLPEIEKTQSPLTQRLLQFARVAALV
ncbi:MAG TPA: hypothetical protein VI685_21390, partial [Candidatus Angelobacter sp.]